MKHWTNTTEAACTTTRLTTHETPEELAIECVTFDGDGRPARRRVMPLLDLLRGLNVTLPVQTTFRTDFPGSV